MFNGQASNTISDMEVQTMATRKRHPFKPGQLAPRSGQYGIIGQRGGNTGAERTVVRGERFPPTPKSGQSYVLVDPTKTKGK